MRSLPFFTVLLLSALVLVWNYSFDHHDSGETQFVSAAVRDEGGFGSYAVQTRTAVAASMQVRAADELVALEDRFAREALRGSGADEALPFSGGGARRSGPSAPTGGDVVPPAGWVHKIESYPGGARRAEGYMAGDLRVGHWMEWFEDGELKSEGAYADGEPEGEWAHHYKSGGLQTREVYRAGELSGVSSTWAQDGALIEHGAFEEGRQVGEWVQWYSNGQVCSRGLLVDGQRTGPWVFYDYHGVETPRTGTYADGQRIGD